MRNDKFFTYIEKHPVAGILSWVIGIGGTVWWFAAIPIVAELSAVHGFGPFILSCCVPVVAWIISGIIDHVLEDRYRGELLTDYFSVYLNDVWQVVVDGRNVQAELIQKKKWIPYFIREKLPHAILVTMYRLPDGKNIYIAGSGEKTTIFLNDTIIMEYDRIYYDRIEKVYGTQQAMQQNVETPVTPVYAQTPVVMAKEQSRVNDTLGLTTPIIPQVNKDAYTLVALEGQFAGQNWELDKSVMLGRDANCCQIVFAADTAGVSRVHCEVGCKDGSLYIRDLGSSYGTTLEDGQVVNNYQEVKLESSDTFRVSANDKFMVIKN